MNEKEETGQADLGPHFTRQPPPRKIGILRSLILAFMAGIGAVDLFLLGGVFLSLSLPSIIPVTAPVVQGSAPVSGLYAVRGSPDGPTLSPSAASAESIPVSSNPEQSGSTEASAPSQPAASSELSPAQGDAPGGESPEGGSPSAGQPVADPGQEGPASTPPPFTPEENQQPSQPNSPEIPDPQGHTIYITEYGKRYHYNNRCNDGTYYESTLEEALSLKLTPCKKCVK